MPRAGPTSSENLTRVKPSEDLPSNCMFGINTHLASCCALRLRTLARSGRNDTDSFVQYLRDPNGRLSVGPSLRLVAVCSSKNCTENGRSFQNWRKNSPNLSVIHLVDPLVARKNQKQCHFLGQDSRMIQVAPMVQVAAQHCAAKIVRRGTNTGKTSNKDSKLAVAKGFSLVMTSFFCRFL